MISETEEIHFQLFVDLSSLELFVDRGMLVMTDLAFPEAGFENIRLYASHESVTSKKGEIYSLRRVWQGPHSGGPDPRNRIC